MRMADGRKRLRRGDRRHTGQEKQTNHKAEVESFTK